MSSASSVNELLAGYAAGRVTAEQLVRAVATSYYGEPAGKREQLRPIIEVIERAHPGVVELSGTTDRPGFAIKLAERPFPKGYEADLRRAVGSVVVSPSRPPNFLTRILKAIRRVFSPAG